MSVPLEIEHRRQCVRIVRHVEDEPQRLLMRGAAPEDHVIGASGDAGALGRLPVLGEFRVEIIAAFGRLDEGELRTCGADLVPIDVALPVGHVDALHRHGVGARHPVMRIGIGDLDLTRDHGPGAAGKDGERQGNKY